MNRNFKFVAFLVIAMLVGSASFALTVVRAKRAEPVGSRPMASKPLNSTSSDLNQIDRAYRQDVAKVLKRHDSAEFDPQVVAEQVRQTGRLSIPSSEGMLELNLVPYDLLASNYQGQVTFDGGDVRSIERGPVRTYKGTVEGVAGAQARFTIDENTVEGLIIMPSQLIFVEPAKRYSALANSHDFVVYKGSDLVATSFGECGVTMAEKVGAEAARVKADVPSSLLKGVETDELFTPSRVVDLATEADFEYFTAFGSNQVAARNEIISIMNQVDGIYNTQFGLRFSIVFQNVWATGADGYTSTDSAVMLDEFTDQWNATRQSVTRDLAHMWTGKNIDENVIGIAFRPGMDCPFRANGYGLSQRLTGSPAKFLVTAHEIGHNFSAIHTNSPTQQPGCTNTIMETSLGSGTLTQFCPFSVNQIETHANSKVACLSQQTTPGCTYSLSPGSQTFNAFGGSGSTNLTTAGSNCAWGATSSAGWITVTTAGSGTNSTTINFSVAANTGGFAREGSIRVGDQTFTVSQAGGSACPVTAITYGQTINASLTPTDCNSSRQSATKADQYSFSGTAGDQIAIAMTSTATPSLDTYLFLMRSNGAAVTENDDTGNTNSRIPVTGFFSLPATGSYTIEATSFDSDDDTHESGSYSLTLSSNAPAPGVVQFTATTAAATETLNATTKVDLTVTRSGNTSGAATIDYASTDVSATERSDYLAAVGTLHFLAGETTKTISIFIVDDSFGEGAETFNVTLSNPVSCTVGATSSTTVTINSNEGADSLNPVRDASFSSDFFVRQHYLDFFNREADAGGLAFWKNQIDECTTQACRDIRRVNVSAAFFLSIEFQQTGYLVYKANQAAFDSGERLGLRAFLSDTQEIGRGVVIGMPGADQQLETNKQNFFLAFVQRPAFLVGGAYPTTLTATQFVDKLIGNTLDPLNPSSGSSLNATERQNLIDQLTDATSPTLRAQVLRSVSENGVFSQRQFNKAFVLMQFFGYMRRSPDAPPDGNFGGYNFWLGKLNQFNGNFVDAEMVKAFITSGEYIQRFGP